MLDELAGLREAALAKESPDLATQARARAAETFPRLAAVGSWLEPSHFDDVFVFGLEMLLSALERAPHESAASPNARKRP